MARNSSVRRVAQILKSFSAETSEMGVTELASKLDLARALSTVTWQYYLKRIF